MKFDGRRKLNLVSEYRDSTMMVEKLGYDLLAAMGVPAPEAKYVRLVINGVYQGVYLDLERVDKNFLDNHGFADDDGTIYRCGRKNCEMKTWLAPYNKDWEKKSNELQDDVALHTFIDRINHTPEPLFESMLEKNLGL